MGVRAYMAPSYPQVYTASWYAGRGERAEPPPAQTPLTVSADDVTLVEDLSGGKGWLRRAYDTLLWLLGAGPKSSKAQAVDDSSTVCAVQ